MKGFRKDWGDRGRTYFWCLERGMGGRGWMLQPDVVLLDVLGSPATLEAAWMLLAQNAHATWLHWPKPGGSRDNLAECVN